jgi:hypothetical protein
VNLVTGEDVANWFGTTDPKETHNRLAYYINHAKALGVLLVKHKEAFRDCRNLTTDLSKALHRLIVTLRPGPEAGFNDFINEVDEFYKITKSWEKILTECSPLGNKGAEWHAFAPYLMERIRAVDTTTTVQTRIEILCKALTAINGEEHTVEAVEKELKRSRER